MLQIGTIYRSEEVDRRLPRAGNIGGEMGVADGKKKKTVFWQWWKYSEIDFDDGCTPQWIYKTIES